MKSLLLHLVALLFLFAASLPAQVENVPTVTQCQADQRLWFSKLQEGHGDSKLIPDVRTVQQWGRVMMECEKVDPDNRPRYFKVLSALHEVVSQRMSEFLQRHNLFDQFLKEDAEGQR